MAVMMKNQWIYLLLFIWVCAWCPLSDPTVIKLVVIPVLFWNLRPVNHLGKALLLLIFIILCLLALGDPLERRFLLAESLCIGFWILGTRFPNVSFGRMGMISSAAALGFLVIQKMGILPWQWNQPIRVFDYEFLGQTYTHPSFFPTPSAMILFFILLTTQINRASIKEKALFLLLTIYPVLQSGSSLGLGLYLVALAHLFLSDKWKHLFWIGIVAVCLALFFLPREETIRPLKNRVILWETALSALQAAPRGFSYFHQHSGELLPPQTTARKMTRNQFHPHNDLLHFGLSLGILGMLLRFCFYLYCLYLIWRLKTGFGLTLFLIQIQFTPDAMSYPTGPFFFFLVGQLHSLHYGSKEELKPEALFSWVSRLICFGMAFFCAGMIQTSWMHTRLKKGEIPTSAPFFPTPSYDYNRAAAYLKKNDPEKAVQILRVVENKYPYFHDSSYLMGLGLAQSGKLGQGEKILRTWIRIDPQHLHTYLLLADILKKRNQLDEAREILRQGIQCLPTASILKEELKRLE